MDYRLAFRNCFSSRAPALALALVLLAVARPAHADARTEAAAKALETKAMQEDYLATEFDKALDKLNQAAGKCGDRCSNILKAQIKRDIGVVQIAKGNHEAAVGAFTEALKADANTLLDPDTRTKEIDAAWAEAKKQAASAGPSGGAPPAGDFTMQPAPETLPHTPLDVFVEYSGTETLAKAVLKYKALGMTEWKTLEMKPMDKGWGAEIPCADVIDGDVLYYVQGFNPANDPVATSGDRNKPFHTTAKRGFTGDVPHFPGKEAPKQCADAGDCPPDFPGCKKPETATEGGENSNLKDEGADCEEDNECKSDKCGSDKTCKGGEKSAAGSRKKFWIGLAFAYDFVAIPGASDVCRLTLQAVPATPYDCTVGGQDFPSRASNAGDQTIDIVPGESDSVSGGLSPGNFRILASFDYAATTNFMVGVRLGYVGNAYNGQAASGSIETRTFSVPLDAELRATYVLGAKDPIGKAGLAGYGMLAGGISQYSAQVGVTAISSACARIKGTSANPTAYQSQCGTSPPPPPCPLNSTTCTTVAQAWATSGPGFVSVGIGLRYAFTPAVALLFGPRFNIAFGPTILPSLSPELGLQYGF